MNKRLSAIIIFLSLALSASAADCFEMPTFLADYYAPAFEVQGKKFALQKHSVNEGVVQFVYSMEDQSLNLSIENIKCDTPRAKAIFNNILGNLNNAMQSNKGEFIKITERDIHAKLFEQGIENTIFVYILPANVQIWSYSSKPDSNYQTDDLFQSLKALVDRQRYNEALSEGNVAMGSWGSEIYDYASKLLKDGNKKEGLSVLQNILATSPYNFRAHMDFIDNTADPKAASDSAQIILKNAENPDLVTKAANYLGVKLMTIDSIPLLEKGETGLQLILIPLDSCDASILEGAAKKYQEITDIPVKIRRIKEVLPLSETYRIPYQRVIQETLVKMNGEDINFADWDKDRYIQALTKGAESKDALTKYYIRDLIAKIGKQSGQYRADPYVDLFSRTLEKYRSNDDRTMYVGITGTNIYSGDNNFVFSLHVARKESQASVLSYYMMTSANLSAEYESRNRLAERIAKELVPASLKSLGIPRSTDPTCPYSYSSGVERLDQKTLTLSEPVKSAIKNIKLQQKN